MFYKKPFIYFSKPPNEDKVGISGMLRQNMNQTPNCFHLLKTNTRRTLKKGQNIFSTVVSQDFFF